MAADQRVVVPVSERLRKAREAVADLEAQRNEGYELLTQMRLLVAARNIIKNDKSILDELEKILWPGQRS